MSGTLENTFHGQKVFSLVMGSFSSSEMQYFYKGGPLRLRIVTKLPGSTKMLEEKNFLFQQRYLGNQMTQVGTKLKIFARTLMSAHFDQVTSSRTSGKEKNAWGRTPLWRIK